MLLAMAGVARSAAVRARAGIGYRKIRSMGLEPHAIDDGILERRLGIA